MRTTWRVQKVTATEGRTVAELARVSWFKKNEDYDRIMADESYDGDLPDEFLDCEPGEPGAEFIDLGGESLTIDVAEGLVLKPGDNVAMVLDVLDPVPV